MEALKFAALPLTLPLVAAVAGLALALALTHWLVDDVVTPFLFPQADRIALRRLRRLEGRTLWEAWGE